MQQLKMCLMKMMKLKSLIIFEDFMAEFKAGAVWGVDQPSFESIKQTQEENSTSHWRPFKNEEEWELTEWLIHNMGQKQTDVFLKLPIV